MFKAKISKGGKISIPAAYRKSLNIKDGEEIVFDIRENEVVISSLKFTLERVRKIVKQYHPTDTLLSEQLITERREEAANE